MSRADRLVALIAERGLDLLLVTDLFNVRYLTGFTGSSGLALVGPDERRFVTDFRYVEQAAAEVEGFDRERAPHDPLETASATLPQRALRLGFDDAHLPVKQHARLRELAPEAVELVPAGGLVEALRAIKEPGELERIRAAAALADDAFEEVIGEGLAGRTEREVALALEDGMRRRGATGPSFASTVAAGAHGALPHAEPRPLPIDPGALVIVDWGAVLDGYCSDCTRTLASGPLDAEAAEAYELVLRAQRAGLQALAPGRTGREVDAAARAVIEEAGRGERFGHGLGHGVGLEVHEGPRLRTRAEEPLQVGNVVTVEPGVYEPGRFGVRIEDLVALTQSGPAVISRFAKELTTVA